MIDELVDSRLHSEMDQELQTATLLSIDQTSQVTSSSVADDFETSVVSKCLLKQAEVDGIRHRLIILDCRFHYEYLGGHIQSAINISSPVVVNYLFSDLKEWLYNSNFVDCLLRLDDRDISKDDLKLLAASAKLAQEVEIQSRGEQRKRAYTLGSLMDQQNKQGLILCNKDVCHRLEPVVVLHCEFSQQRGPGMFR